MGAAANRMQQLMAAHKLSMVSVTHPSVIDTCAYLSLCHLMRFLRCSAQSDGSGLQESVEGLA